MDKFLGWKKIMSEYAYGVVSIWKDFVRWIRRYSYVVIKIVKMQFNRKYNREYYFIWENSFHQSKNYDFNESLSVYIE